MRRVVLTIGLLLIVAGFSRLAAQPFVLDPNRQRTTPGGITVGPFAPQKQPTGAETENEAPGGGLPNLPNVGPGFGGNFPNFGGGGFRPRMSLSDIQRMRAEEAWRKREEFDRQHQQIEFEQRVRNQLDAVLRSLNMDLFGEVDEIPTNLRKEEYAVKNVDRNRSVPDSTETPESREAEDRIVRAPLGPVRTPTVRSGTGSTTNAQEPQDDSQRMEEEETRKRMEEIRRQREEALVLARERRLQAEKGANLFEMPTELRISEQHLKAGRCRLFDGETFFGWRTQKEGPYGGGRFFIENSMICSDPERPGLLYTTNQFGDATFHLEYQAEEDAEVFLLVRTSPNPRDLHSSCYAVVLNSADFLRPRGTILGRQTLSVDQLQKQLRDADAAMAADKIPPGKRWRNVAAQFDGGVFRVTIDKEEAITVFEAKPPGCGYLGILVTKGTARFRNMTWVPGSSISLFDGVDPTPEWRHRETVKWTPTRSVTLQLTGGPGVVETVKSFDNFVLQLEYNMTFSSGRSGLFFRSTPREEQTGYEISLQNFPTREERQSTIGVDVGSFRNVKNGRYLRVDDQKWNYLTVLAVDRHFQTWVNGVPVSEWTVPADQPLTVSGTLQLLAPTERTDVQFRNIRVTQILPRSERPRTFQDRVQTTYDELSEQRRAADRERQLDQEMRRQTPPK